MILLKRDNAFFKSQSADPRTNTAYDCNNAIRGDARHPFFTDFAPIKNSNFMYGDKVAIISLNEHPGRRHH